VELQKLSICRVTDTGSTMSETKFYGGEGRKALRIVTYDNLYDVADLLLLVLVMIIMSG